MAAQMPTSSVPPVHHLPQPSSSLSASSRPAPTTKQKARSKRANPSLDSSKRRCVSTACVACRKRKSKCDGNTPACAACSSVYGTECVYDPNSDHRRKGVYRQDIDNLKDRTSTLQTLVEAILNAPQDDVSGIVQQIRAADSLDLLATKWQTREVANLREGDSDQDSPGPDDELNGDIASFESQLSNKLGQLRVDAGSTRFFGGTSNLVYFGDTGRDESGPSSPSSDSREQQTNPIASWTSVTSDTDLIIHLLNMYFTWHYSFFTTLSRTAFYQHFMLGKPPAGARRKIDYCTPLLVNAMLALGCHFTARPDAFEDPDDVSTAGDHFFKEAKRLIAEEEEYEHPKLATVQALALMSVREAGCGREAKGWTYSGIAFRMACDLGLNLDSGGIASEDSSPDEQEEDVRRMTFWGCFLFDKCWSNYLGRLPHFQSGVNITCPKFEVFPNEDAAHWIPYSDHGYGSENTQPSRVRVVARHLMDLCDISSDLMKYFYHPQEARNPPSKQAEIKRLGEIHTRLESWKKELPNELDPSEGALPSVLVMHMFFHLLYIHLFRPFLKYAPKTSPLPSNVSPRRQCTHGAAAISKLLRLYKRSYGLRQICNIVVYIAHSACTIHLLNLPEKNAKRDINHGVKELEEIADGWPCARRTLLVLSMQARKWNIDLPEETATVLQKFDSEVGLTNSSGSSPRHMRSSFPYSQSQPGPVSPSPTPDQQMISGDGAFSGMNEHDLLDDLNASLASVLPHGAPFGFAPLQHDSLTSGSTTGGGPSPASHAMPSPTSAHIAFQDPSQSQQFTWPQSSMPSSGPPPGYLKNGMNSSSQPYSAHQFQPPVATLQGQQIQNELSMQPPPLPRQHPRSSQAGPPRPKSASHPQASNPPEFKMPRQASQMQANSRRPSASDNMFGGVRALLSESQDFWLRDQSKIASGFGNWRGAAASSVPSTPTSDAAMMNNNAAAGTQGGPSPASSTASAVSAGVNLDHQCGVAEPSGALCSRGLGCEFHAVHAKRLVHGRSRPFDTLLGAEMARRWELERRRAPPGDVEVKAGAREEEAEWCG